MKEFLGFLKTFIQSLFKNGGNSAHVHVRGGYFGLPVVRKDRSRLVLEDSKTLKNGGARGKINNFKAHFTRNL